MKIDIRLTSPLYVLISNRTEDSRRRRGGYVLIFVPYFFFTCVGPTGKLGSCVRFFVSVKETMPCSSLPPFLLFESATEEGTN